MGANSTWSEDSAHEDMMIMFHLLYCSVGGYLNCALMVSASEWKTARTVTVDINTLLFLTALSLMDWRKCVSFPDSLYAEYTKIQELGCRLILVSLAVGAILMPISQLSCIDSDSTNTSTATEAMVLPVHVQ